MYEKNEVNQNMIAWDARTLLKKISTIVSTTKIRKTIGKKNEELWEGEISANVRRNIWLLQRVLF